MESSSWNEKASTPEELSSSGLAEPLLAEQEEEPSNSKDSTDAEAVGLVTHDSATTTTWTTGTVQPPAYRDVGFAIAFYVHFVIVVGITCMIRPSVLVDEEGRSLEQANNAWNVHQILGAIVWILAISIGTVVLLITVTIRIMYTYPIPLIQGTLLCSTGFPLVLGIVTLVVSPNTTGLLASLPFFLLAFVIGWYTRTVWGRIPYAASNLRTALVAVHCHAMGLVGTSLGGLGTMTLWMLLWGGSMAGLATSSRFWTDPTVHCHTSSGTADDEDNHSCPDPSLNGLGGITLVFLIISNYWVGQVIKNVLRTTVAGTVATWWFESSSTPTARSSCCSPVVSDSLHRSTTYSFGSICFGSLVVAVLHTLRDVLHSVARRNRRVLSAFLVSILECVVLYIEKLVEYFNKWSFIYVGLYGYGYIEASQKVMALFTERNWMPVIADDLVNRLLGAICLTVSLLAGVVCVVVAAWLGVHKDTPGTFCLVAGVIGTLLAVVVSSLLVSILSSAVDTILVCYAEAPTELQRSHPVLADEMEHAWTEAWRDPQSGLVLITLGAGPGLI